MPDWTEDVRWEADGGDRPTLRRPLLLAAFEGWNDAGDAASTAVRYLADAWDAEPLASVDPDEFYDFTVVRPLVTLDESLTRHVEWRTTELSVARVPGTDRDVVFVHGIEPNLRWRRYTDALAGAAAAVGVELVITLGALLAEVAHTQDVPITGTGTDPELIADLGLQRSRYEGPTGIIGVLHDRLGSAGLRSMSLWAAVPHYIRETASPKAALALVRRAGEVLRVPVDTTELEIASAAYERQVNEVVSADADVEAYVRHLEEETPDDGPELRLKSAEELAAEAERFLRDQGP